MIRHISLYKLKDINDIDFVVTKLDELKDCQLINDNRVCVCYKKDLPNIKKPIFANIMHEAFFNDEEDAKAFPQSNEHLKLVKETDGLLDSVVTFDYKYE